MTTTFEIKPEYRTVRGVFGIRGLRLHPKYSNYYAYRDAERKKREVRFATYCEEDDADADRKSVLYVQKNQQKSDKPPQLFQEDPHEKNHPEYLKCLPKGVTCRSYTHSYESFKSAADKEAAILETNNRLPTKQILWKMLIDLTAPEIRELISGVFRYLGSKGLEAYATIELTRDSYGNKTSRVHLHIITDDSRSNEDLENLIIAACKRRGLVESEDYTISFPEITKPETFFDYFTKRTRTDKDECARMGWNRVILFQPELRIQKFREIKKGTWFRKSKNKLWEEFLQKNMETTISEETKQNRNRTSKEDEQRMMTQITLHHVNKICRDKQNRHPRVASRFFLYGRDTRSRRNRWRNRIPKNEDENRNRNPRSRTQRFGKNTAFGFTCHRFD